MDDLTADILSKLNGRMTARVLKGGVELTIFMPFSEKPEKKSRKSKELATIDINAMNLAALLFSHAINYLPPATADKKDQTIPRWAADIEKINRIDKVEYPHVATIMAWAMQDGFWCSNILSGAKLRKQFPTLWAQAKSYHEKNTAVEV